MIRALLLRPLPLLGLAASLWGSIAHAAISVTSIAPASGNIAGGTPFTVTGLGFVAGASVKIGNVACTDVSVISGTRIMGVTGAHAAGAVSVTVFNTAADSSASNSLYDYNSNTDVTRTTKSDFEAATAARSNLNTVALDSTLRWTAWTPTTGGSMSAGSYYYVLTATTAQGETQRSVPTIGTTLSGGNNAVRLSWTSISGAVRYKVYRSTTSGTYNTPALIATLDTTGYTDGAAAPAAGAPPGSNTASGDLFLSYGTTPASAYTSGPTATASLQDNAFSLQRPNQTFLLIHAGNTTTTSVYDATAGSLSAGPALTGAARKGTNACKRPDGKFLIVHGNGSTGTSLYDPVANTMAAGPATTATVDKDAANLKRPDGKFLLILGNGNTSTSLYDPVANTMAAGPALTSGAREGTFAVQRPDGKFLIVHGGGNTGTSIYDPVANSMAAGPVTTASVGDGAHAIQRPDGRYLIVHAGSATSTSLYNPDTNTMAAGPTASSQIAIGGHALQRADGRFLIIAGGSSANTVIYDPVANTMSSGPALGSNVGQGGHSLQRPDGKYLVVHGGGTTTSLYDAGWYRTGSYVSEKLHPADINWWNSFAWVTAPDDTLSTKIKTASSSAGLDGATWRSVANGASIAPGTGETWLQVGVDFARAIPKSSLALEDVWGRWGAEFREWAAPDVLSWTASYVPTGLSVSPGKSTFAFGGQALSTWVAPDSTSLRNDGTLAETLLGKISTLTAGASTWTLSASANGPDQVRAQWSVSSSVGPWNDIAAYGQDFRIKDSVAVGDSVKFFFRIQTPTSNASSAQYSSTLTVTAQ